MNYSEGYYYLALTRKQPTGIVLSRQNLPLLKETGKVFYLYATPEETFNRVKGDTGRPLLDSESEEKLKEKIVKMLEVRYHSYMRTADHRIDTDGRTVKELVDIITHEAVNAR